MLYRSKRSSVLVKALPALALALFHPLISRANTITFNDIDTNGVNAITDVITNSGTGEVIVGSCVASPSPCTIKVYPPTAYGPPPGGSTTSFASLNIFSPTIPSDIIATLTVTGTFDASFNTLYETLVFASGNNMTSVGGNNITDTGAPQIPAIRA